VALLARVITTTMTVRILILLSLDLLGYITSSYGGLLLYVAIPAASLSGCR
jgi:hypothetical protein